MTELNLYGKPFQIADDPTIVVGASMTEGHVQALRNARVANLRNLFTQRLKGKEFDPTEVQADMDKAAASFQFGVSRRGAGRRVVDPVEREALKIARDTIAIAYQTKHHTKIDNEALRTSAARLMELNGEDFRSRARTRIREQSAAGANVLDALGLGDVPQAEQAAA